MNKISIVIPTFNQYKYLPACIDYCIFQTYKNLEIIVVDGGSTDGTKEYLGNLKDIIQNTTESPVSYMDENGKIIREKVKVYFSDIDLKVLIF